MKVIKHIVNQVVKYIGLDVHRDSTTVRAGAAYMPEMGMRAVR